MKPLSEVIVEQVDKEVKNNSHIKTIPNAAIRNAVKNKVREDVLTYKVDQLLKRPVDQVVAEAVESILTDLKLLSSKSKVTPLSARKKAPAASVSSGAKPGGGKSSSVSSAPIRSGAKPGGGKSTSVSAPVRSGSKPGGGKGSSVSSTPVRSGSKPGGGGKGSSYSAPIRSGSGGKGGGKIGYVDTREAAINMASGSPSSLKPIYGRFTKPIL